MAFMPPFWRLMSLIIIPHNPHVFYLSKAPEINTNALLTMFTFKNVPQLVFLRFVSLVTAKFCPIAENNDIASF